MYIELKITTNILNKEAIYLWLYSKNIFEITEYSNDVLEEVKRSEISWDFLNDDDYGEEVTLLIYPEDEKSARDIAKAISKEYEAETKILVKDEKDWANNWKKYYKSTNIGEKLVIVPQWENCKTDRLIVRIDPGMAFGTGTHESTVLSLELLEKYFKKDMTLADIGCGSGILGITGLKLGAKFVDFVDIDEKAIVATKDNLDINEIDFGFKIHKDDLLNSLDKRYDLIISNIIAEVLVREIKDLGRFLKEDAIFISSGIIEDKKDMVVNALRENYYEILEIKNFNSWVGIVAKCTDSSMN